MRDFLKILLDKLSKPLELFKASNEAGRENIMAVHKDYDLVDLEVPEKYLRTTMSDMDSFIAYVKKYFDKAKAICFYDEDRVKAIGDIEKPDEAEVKYTFGLSRQAKAWLELCHSSMRQKGFKDFLEVRIDEYNEHECGLYQAMALLNLSKEIEYTSAVDDGNNVSVAFSIQDTEQTTKIAKDLVAHFPMFKGEEPVEVPFRVKFNQPTAVDEHPTFMLECHQWEDILEAEVEKQIKKLKSELEGYEIFYGSETNHTVQTHPVKVTRATRYDD